MYDLWDGEGERKLGVRREEVGVGGGVAARCSGPIRKDEEGGIKELGMRNERLGIGDSKKYIEETLKRGVGRGAPTPPKLEYEVTSQKQQYTLVTLLGL